jgi:hypothetical protein
LAIFAFHCERSNAKMVGSEPTVSLFSYFSFFTFHLFFLSQSILRIAQKRSNQSLSLSLSRNRKKSRFPLSQSFLYFPSIASIAQINQRTHIFQSVIRKRRKRRYIASLLLLPDFFKNRTMHACNYFSVYVSECICVFVYFSLSLALFQSSHHSFLENVKKCSLLSNRIILSVSLSLFLSFRGKMKKSTFFAFRTKPPFALFFKNALSSKYPKPKPQPKPKPKQKKRKIHRQREREREREKKRRRNEKASLTHSLTHLLNHSITRYRSFTHFSLDN